MNYMGLRMISKAIITSEDSILNNDTVPISTLDEWEGMNMDVEVGLIWSHEDYLMRKDREWANAIPGWELTGQWRTTVPGKMSVVGYKKIIEESLGPPIADPPSGRITLRTPLYVGARSAIIQRPASISPAPHAGSVIRWLRPSEPSRWGRTYLQIQCTVRGVARGAGAPI